MRHSARLAEENRVILVGLEQSTQLLANDGLMTLPEITRRIAEHHLSAFCGQRAAAQGNGRVRLTYLIEGCDVTLIEERYSPGQPDRPFRSPVARFRFDTIHGTWTLFWLDCNNEWHRHEELEPDRDFGALLREVGEDPTAIVWSC